MGKQSQPRILRNYRNLKPTRFHAFNQKVRKAIVNKEKFPDTMWASNPMLLPSYLMASEKHDATYHESLYGSRLVIADREILQAQIVDHLDEIASIVEAAAVRSAELLLYSGFDVARERRSQPRRKVASTPSQEGDTYSSEQPFIPSTNPLVP